MGGTFLTALPSREEEKRRRCAQELLPRFPAFSKDPHSVIINSSSWQHIVFRSRQREFCVMTCLRFVFCVGMFMPLPLEKLKGTKTPLAGARAYVQTRRHTRAQARVPDRARAAAAEGRPGRPGVEEDAPRPPVRPCARQAFPGLGRDP